MPRQANYIQNDKGSVAPIFGMTLMVIVALVGVTLALGMDSRAANNLQASADAAAIAGATAFVSTNSPRAEDRLKEAEVAAAAAAASNADYFLTDLSVSPLTEDAYGQHTEIEVNLAFSPANPAANIAGRNGNIEIMRSAAAAATWGFPLCILALSDSGQGLSTSGAANLRAEECIIWTNSTDGDSMNFAGGDAETKFFCAAGRARISGGTQVSPRPHQNCDPIPDPLSEWAVPESGTPIIDLTPSANDLSSRNKMALLGVLNRLLNDHSLRSTLGSVRHSINGNDPISDADLTIVQSAFATLNPTNVRGIRFDVDGTIENGPAAGLLPVEVMQVLGLIDNIDPLVYDGDVYVNLPSETLYPGTYAGLDISSGHVKMEPGVYHIVDAPLVVRRRATLTGEGVTLIFHGDDATFSVLDEARLTLTGPETGETAGFILAEHRDDTPGDKSVRSRLTGSGKVEAIGTIYLPKHTLAITGDGAADQTSPLLQIVADTVAVSDNGALDILFAPGETTVPVAIMPQHDARLIR